MSKKDNKERQNAAETQDNQTPAQENLTQAQDSKILQQDLQGAQSGEDGGQKKSNISLYIAIGCLAVAAVLFILAFALTPAVKGVGVYLLIASAITALAGASFINAQKRQGKTKLLLALQIVAYVIMLGAVAIIALGVGFTAPKNGK